MPAAMSKAKRLSKKDSVEGIMLNVEELENEAEEENRSPMHLKPAEQIALKMALKFGAPDEERMVIKSNVKLDITKKFKDRK